MSDDRRPYDVVVIGTGTAGQTAAYQLQEAGKRVAIVDSVPFGGTCALRGCQPKKYLVVNTHLAADTRALLGKGFSQGAVTDWVDLQAFKHEFTDPVPQQSAQGFHEQGIDSFCGEARFLDTSTITLDPGGEVLSAETFLIATGARPRSPGIEGERFAGTSDDFLDLPALPESMVFIGGGYISLEFAFIAGIAGSQVTILQRGDRVLPQFPASLVDRVLESMTQHNITVITDVEVERIDSHDGGMSVATATHGSFPAGFVMSAVGRVPNIDRLGLERIGVGAGPRGIEVDEFMRTSVKNIYAVGDCVNSKQLAPISDLEAKAAAANIVEAGQVSVDYSAIPSVVFSHPQMASVGLTVQDAQAMETATVVRQGSGAGWPNYRRLNASPVYYETVTEAATGRILGAHIVSPYAGEQINLFALAIASGFTAERFRQLPWAYPTYTADVKYMV